MNRTTVVERALSCFVVGFEEVHTLRGRWRARGLGPADRPPFAMRMTRDGIELGRAGDGGPVTLPWAAFDGFRLRSTLGRQVLEPILAPGHPVAAALDRIGVALLDQPLAAIDCGLRHFSAGRAGIVRAAPAAPTPPGSAGVGRKVLHGLRVP